MVPRLHLPVRPGGSCQDCGGPWPCPTQQAALLAEFSDAPATLLIYLSLHLVEAIEHNEVDTAEDLYARFLGWVRPALVCLDTWLGPSIGSGAADPASRRHGTRHEASTA
jgi:hypothetical protein